MFNVTLTDYFKRDVRYYIKKKKYRHITDDIQDIVDQLRKGKFIGDEIQGLKLPKNEKCYKVRVANTDLNVGKSNGYRIIYYCILDDKQIFLLTIYSKKDQEDIENKKIKQIIEEYCL